MNMHDYLKDVHKVLRKRPYKQFITEPVEQPEKIVTINVNYNDFTKHELIKMLKEPEIKYKDNFIRAS